MRSHHISFGVSCVIFILAAAMVLSGCTCGFSTLTVGNGLTAIFSSENTGQILFPSQGDTEPEDEAPSEDAPETMAAASDIIEYWVDIPKTVVGNFNRYTANCGRFSIFGDESVVSGLANCIVGSGSINNARYFSTNLADGMALLYLRPNKTYEIEIQEYGTEAVYAAHGLVGDGRVMKQTVRVDAAGAVSVSRCSWEDANGPIGDQTSFIMRVKNPWDPWTNGEKAMASKLLSDMTVEEKVGQLLLLHYPGDGAGTAADANRYIDTYHPGGFLAFTPMFAQSNPEQVKAKTAAAQEHTKIPLLFTVDEEGGKVTRISQYGAFYPAAFPYPQALVSGGISAVEADGKAKAGLLLDLGFNVNHAPVADVSGPTGYVYTRTYGKNGFGNAPFVAASVRGQEDNGLGTTLKHFPGYGGTSSNTHEGYAVNDLSMDEFHHNDLIPFYAGLAAGSDAVMVTHNIINAFDTENPASLSPILINYLREFMGFDGVVMTDDLGMRAVADKYPNGGAALTAVLAGADMTITPNPDVEYPILLAAAKDRRLPAARLDEAVLRILCWKSRLGLFNLVEGDPSNAEAMWTNGSGWTLYGKFSETWNEALMNGGMVELLKDVSVSSLTPKGNITLNLNGHKLTLTGSAGIMVESGAVFDIMDARDAYLSNDGFIAISSNYRKPVKTTVQNSTAQAGYDSAGRVLTWNEVDPETGKKVQYRTDFSGTGSIVGIAGTAGITVNNGVLNFRGGTLTHPGQGIVVTGGSVNFPETAGSILGCGYGTKQANGGAIDLRGGTLNMKAGYLGGNQAATRGGAVSVGSGSKADVIIDGADVTIACNSSGIQAGGFYIYSNGALDFKKGRIASNTAVNGGGIYVLTGSRTTIGNPGASEQPTSGTLNCIITDNKASGQGGGIFTYQSSSVLQVYGTAITGNEAPEGGGIRIGDNSAAKGGWFESRHSIISYNKANGGSGGGIRFDVANPASITDVSIHHNTAKASGGTGGYGGGIYLNATSVTMDTVSISENTADVRGGGMEWPNADSAVRLNGMSVIAGNKLTGGSSSNVKLSPDCRFYLYDQVLPVGSKIQFEVSVYPDAGETVPVVTGTNRGIVANSQHAFKLEDGLEAYQIVLHDTESELDLISQIDEDLSVDISGVLFQWYAPVKRLAISGNNERSLKVIDTHSAEAGHRLPENGSALPGRQPILRYLFLEEDGEVLYTERLTALYASRDLGVTNLGRIEKQWRFGDSDSGYSRHQVWVAENGERALSIDPADFKVYNWRSGMSFTTDPSKAGPDVIYVGKGYVIRFVGAVKTGVENTEARFYDYDITNGKVYSSYDDMASDRNPLSVPQITQKLEAGESVYVNTQGQRTGQGINHSSNYPGGASASSAFAFGNGNTGVPWMNATFGASQTINNVLQESKMNVFNRTNFEGCTFGLVTGLDENGLPVFADGIKVPPIFDAKANVIGREVYDDLGLQFRRYGNTLTLTAVSGTNFTGLETFRHPGIYDGVQHKTVIWTNDFWPMDEKVQPGDGHDITMGKTGTKIFYRLGGMFPPSDDGLAHNSYFGMNFNVEFTLDADFIGPMVYTFFGDDDVWLFLDDELIVDIGGVHRSVGMYVDLWDYLDAEKDAGTHTLRFFFLERGASGSTCWMNLCLPNAMASEPILGSLRLEKEVFGEGAETDKEFEFEVTLDLSDAEGNVSDGVFEFEGSKNGSFMSGDTISLKHGEYVIIKNLPVGTSYRIREIPSLGYTPILPGNENGTISLNDITVKIRNRRDQGSVLPETGGGGARGFLFTGAGLLALGLLAWIIRRRKLQ